MKTNLCICHILNGLSDGLFDTYQNEVTAKELWDKLETRYMTEDVTNFKRSLKHKKEEISLEALANHLRIEEEYRKQDQNLNSENAKLHVTEEVQTTKPFKRKFKQTDKALKFKKKQKDSCYHCGKPRHFKNECQFLKKKSSSKADNNGKFAAMIFEINMAQYDNTWWIDMGATNNTWWIDMGATKHVCKDKSMFTKFTQCENDNVLYMENSSTAEIKGKRSIELQFTFGKVLTLNDVYYVPEVRKNLVSESLLNKFGFKLVFEADKFILSKGGIFVGKGPCENRAYILTSPYSRSHESVCLGCGKIRGVTDLATRPATRTCASPCASHGQ
ncbi:hypothetical protein CXB51_004144 [Gossypium anomalum]|uniref:CCHC-type domain-containing protein n=1 Tax=Gossypium anomalum TaxID=47600 RepID=A0A8J5ZJH0_9ROSI|nr:hypothetical protein CXB51_004144 [Gossypium anomalum]